MKKIASFSVNHDKLKKGMYVSRIDGDVVTYDLRMKVPNAGDYLSNGALHTCTNLVNGKSRKMVIPNTRCRRKTNATPLSISDDPPRKVTMLCAQPTSFIISLPSGYCAENGMVLSPSRHWISKMLMMIISGVVEVARTR